MISWQWETDRNITLCLAVREESDCSFLQLHDHLHTTLTVFLSVSCTSLSICCCLYPSQKFFVHPGTAALLQKSTENWRSRCSKSAAFKSAERSLEAEQCFHPYKSNLQGICPPSDPLYPTLLNRTPDNEGQNSCKNLKYPKPVLSDFVCVAYKGKKGPSPAVKYELYGTSDIIL